MSIPFAWRGGVAAAALLACALHAPGALADDHPSHPPQAVPVPKPPASSASNAFVEGQPGEHRMTFQPSDWATVYWFEDNWRFIPVDECGTGVAALSDPDPRLWVGYDHDGCDGIQNSLAEGAVRFDLNRLASIPHKLVTRATLTYGETPFAERGPGGTPMSVFNCATRLDPASEDAQTNWIRFSHGRPGREHRIDGDGWYLVNVDDSREIALNAGAVNITPLVVNWLTHPDAGRRTARSFL